MLGKSIGNAQVRLGEGRGNPEGDGNGDLSLVLQIVTDRGIIKIDMDLGSHSGTSTCTHSEKPGKIAWKKPWELPGDIPWPMACLSLLYGCSSP